MAEVQTSLLVSFLVSGVPSDRIAMSAGSIIMAQSLCEVPLESCAGMDKV